MKKNIKNVKTYKYTGINQVNKFSIIKLQTIRLPNYVLSTYSYIRSITNLPFHIEKQDYSFKWMTNVLSKLKSLFFV